jgi:hypothetical protein
MRVGLRATDVEQVVIVDAGRAGGFAVAARQAAIQMQLCLRGWRRALEHLLDQVDAPARAVEFVAEQLIGRARRVTETAMHTGAQDFFRLGGAGQLSRLFAEGGLHG